MIFRCSDPSNPDYGSKGVRVCDRWKDFELFLADMGERPSVDHSIERLDSNAGYAPDNCKWATTKEQNWNKGDTVRVTFNGATVPLKEVARQTGIRYQRLHFWHRTKNLPIEAAIARASNPGRWAT